MIWQLVLEVRAEGLGFSSHSGHKHCTLVHGLRLKSEQLQFLWCCRWLDLGVEGLG